MTQARNALTLPTTWFHFAFWEDVKGYTGNTGSSAHSLCGSYSVMSDKKWRGKPVHIFLKYVQNMYRCLGYGPLTMGYTVPLRSFFTLGEVSRDTLMQLGFERYWLHEISTIPSTRFLACITVIPFDHIWAQCHMVLVHEKTQECTCQSTERIWQALLHDYTFLVLQ